jgi:hypothetical protein
MLAAGSPIATFSRKWREHLVAVSIVLSLKLEERKMPVILLWGLPAIVVIGGVGYYLVHMH